MYVADYHEIAAVNSLDDCMVHAHSFRFDQILKNGFIQHESITDMGTENIGYFFRPRSAAVIGASRDPRKFGHIIFRNLLESTKVYPVNPKAEEVLGEKCYPSVKEIPGPVDLAVIALPAKHVVSAVGECRDKDVKAAVIITAGFAESGNSAGETAILNAKGGMRIIGPNVIGIYDSFSGVDTVFNLRHRQRRPRQGSISFISQSGAFGSAVIDTAASESVGLSKFVSLGNMADVDEADMIDFLLKDKSTKVIAMYLEGSKDYRQLYEKIKSSSKPVIVVKAGKTKASAKAIASHTASLAGPSELFSGMLRQAGAIEAAADDMFDIARVFSQPRMRNNRVHIVTDGGGFGILAADAVMQNHLRLSVLSKKTADKIASHVPSYASISNPLDLTGDADTERYRKVLPLVLADKGVDAVIVILLMQISALDSKIIGVLEEAKHFNKPIAVCMTGGEFTNIHRKLLEERGIPTYSTPERAAYVLGCLHRFSKNKRQKSE